MNGNLGSMKGNRGPMNGNPGIYKRELGWTYEWFFCSCFTKSSFFDLGTKPMNGYEQERWDL